MKLKPGASLGAYRIVGELGRGGMGVVYQAYQPSLDRFVAIKVLPAFFAEDERLRARFKHEAVTIAQLDHPAILPVYEYGEKGNRSYIVMALAEGGTLAAQAVEPMSVEAVVKLLAPIADALDHAHQRGILHRDVKPANVLLRRDGRPMLSDFGLARSADANSGLTQSGMALGTPDYMAPELWRGEPAGPASDQYSLAVMCHELLTGRVQPDLNQAPANARAALTRALAKSPKERFPSCSDFVQAVSPQTATPLPAGGISRLLIAGAAALLAVLIGGTLLAVRGGHLPAIGPISAAGRSPASAGAPHAVSVVVQGLKSPSAIALGPDGTLYIADTGSNTVRKVDPVGKATLVAGSFQSPSGLAVDAAGDLFISDSGGNRVLLLDPKGVLSVYAGDGKAGSSGDGGLAASAELSAPSGLAFQVGPNATSPTEGSSLWIIDRGNNKLRQVLTDGTILSPSTISPEGGAFDPKLAGSGGIGFTPNGNRAWVYLSSADANQLFSRATGGIPIPTRCQSSYCMAVLAGNGAGGYAGDDGEATRATLNHPGGIAVNTDSDIYVADTGNNVIRRVDHTGLITTVVGGGSNRNATKPLEIQLNAPTAVALAADGTLYIADTGNDRILKVAP
jgi:predicted Ser/Thr protein kinase